MSDKSAANCVGIAIARRDKPAELDQIDPPLAVFNFRDPTMWQVKASGEFALREACVCAGLVQLRAQSGIFRRVSRFPHCSDYRNKLECSQNRNTIMLTLPNDWTVFHGGAVAEHLLAQVREPWLRIEFARHVLQASFALFDAASLKRTGRLRRIRALPNMRWRFGDGSFAYFPESNDEALALCVNGRSKPRIWTAIVPTSFEFVFRAALEAADKKWKPIVFSLDGFIAWRTMFGGADLDVSRFRVHQFLFRRYHRSLLRDRRLRKLRIADAEVLLRKSRVQPEKDTDQRMKRVRATRPPS